MRIEYPPSNTILHGAGVPGGAPELDPLDGVNDPWRWYPTYSAWVGPAVEVTVANGAVLDPSGATIPAGSEPPQIYVSSATTLTEATHDVTQGLLAASAAASNTVAFGGAPSDPSPGGTGIAFLIQYEAGYPTTPGAVPDATLDVADYLGTGFTVGTAYAFPEPADVGTEGDFYIDTTTGNMYGPKTSGGTWPGPIGFGTVVLPSPGGTLYRLAVADDGALSTVAV